MTRSTSSAERRPVPIVEKDLETCLLGKLAGFDVEDDDTGFCAPAIKQQNKGYQRFSVRKKIKAEGERHARCANN